MRIRDVLAAVVAVVCIAACAPDDGAQGGPPGTGQEPGTQATEGATASGSGSAAPEGSQPTDGGAPGPVIDSEAQVGSEAMPEPPEPTPLSELVTPPSSPEPITQAPAPGTSTTGLVESFPSTALLIPEGAEVTGSSVSGEGDRAQVTLDVDVPGTCSDTLIAYREWFRHGGYTETATNEAAERSTLTFERPASGRSDVVTLSADPSGAQDTCSVSVFGVLAVPQ